MKPIVITTPRSGSNLFCQMLGNLAKQHYGYKDNLYEVFTVIPLFKGGFIKVDGCIKSTGIERTGVKWYESAREEKLKRLQLFENDHNYLMKVFPSDLEPEIEDMIHNNYDCIYLERKDKVGQLLSLFGLFQTNVSHHKDNSKQINEIYYDKKITEDFIAAVAKYNRFKASCPSKYPTVYYEDFIANGGNELAVIQLLNLPISVYIPEQAATIPTPYLSNIESLIVNKDEWLADKDTIIKALYA